MASISWDEYLMGFADAASLKSKDSSTKLGAVIAGPDNEIRTSGFNSFPKGINDSLPERQVRPEKYKWIEHAERNAIYMGARHGASLKGCTLYCAWPPCTDCARAVIQVGIIKIVVKTLDIPDRWLSDMTTSITMLKEAGVAIQPFDEGSPKDWDMIIETYDKRIEDLVK